MKKIKLGYAPTRRSIFSAPDALKFRGLTAQRLTELGVDFVDITDINEEGLLYDDKDVNADDYTPEECYVLPQSTNELTASFTVTVKDALDAVVMRKDFTGDAAVSLNVTNATEWQNGFAYNYTAALTPAVIDPTAKPIQFTATADTWIENNSGNGTPIIPQP